MQFQRPRGTQDRLPAEQAAWDYVTAVAGEQARRFGYGRIDTPVFEPAGLFHRGVGAGTDIVEKETYTFPDRSGEEMTLRAEGTAPVCRAYLEHGMHTLLQPVRMHYVCPIFRYERPQAGRLRQHHQFGVEAIGDGDPAIDAEVIELGWRLMEALGLRGVTLALNSIGDAACRPQYLEALRGHYAGALDRVCTDCRMRYERNPLRMLDCKRRDLACQDMIATAPQMAEALCADCDAHFAQVRRYMDALDIPYAISPTLVRGLDYYTRTVFEMHPPEEGAQSAVLAGGRYDGLIEQLGGRPTPGIGFGSGIERLILNVQRQEAATPPQSATPDAVIVSLGGAAGVAVRLASDLRQVGYAVTVAQPGRSLRGQMRYAAGLGARCALVLGDAEAAAGTVQVKTLETGVQQEARLEDVARLLATA